MAKRSYHMKGGEHHVICTERKRTGPGRVCVDSRARLDRRDRYSGHPWPGYW